MSYHIFGIRHHGPGCAASLRAALDELQPDVIVLEAPADVEPILTLAGEQGMQPPVGMLIYPRDEPQRSVVYPFAVFSPEWQALRWALQRNIPVRAMDLPLSLQFGRAGTVNKNLPDDDSSAAIDPPEQRRTWRTDPIAILAEAAGYDDHELWWEEQVERREQAAGLFQAIQEAMSAVREDSPEESERDQLREAYMRKTIRAVKKEGFQSIAVVCGAWHGPLLDEQAIAGKREGCRIKDDNARLKGLPREKTIATWIPWTHSRLAYRSGYGAGVHSPGWYAHLWESPSEGPTRWIVEAARLLRENDLGASSADVIEARRLADALAALRELRAPGLRELNEAIQTVLCHGDDAPLKLIRQRLEIGDQLGSVPHNTPSVPLAADLERLQKSLRLKPSTSPRLLDLDLRTSHAREQSRLLHRLRILGIAWGEPQNSESSQTTFHEIWQIEWQPEFAISIIEANVWGNTVEAAAAARTLFRAEQSTTLRDTISLLDLALHAELTAVFPALVQRIQSTSAVATDVVHLMEAFPALANIVKYGNVRETNTLALESVLDEICTRAVVGLVSACTSLDDDSAKRMLDALAQMQQALDLLQRPELKDPWNERLGQLMRGEAHGLVRGWCTRTLLEQQLLDTAALEQQTRLALSPVNKTAQAAAWITGLLHGSGLLLVHQASVWRVMDDWLTGLPHDIFVETLPLLRRAFSSFSHAERRQMGENVKRLNTNFEDAAHRESDHSVKLDPHRAALVLPVLARILGVRHDET